MNVKIEKLVYGGEGLGHNEGRTVFVPFVLPDEVVAVRPVATRKKFVRGRVQEVLTASPERTAPPCPHFAVCGGCHYQHIPYEAQLKYKVEILRETLRRIGRVNWEGPISAQGSPPFGYRNRAHWEVRPAGEDSGAAIGYHQAGSSALCPVEECPILSPRLAETLAALRELFSAGKAPATLREVEAFADSADAKILLNVSLEKFDVPPTTLAGNLRNALPGIESILLHDAARDHFELLGPGFLHYDAGGSRYRVGHLSFFQVNRFLVDELVRGVVEEERGALALDLFAGVGLFTIPLSRRFKRVLGVESNLAAARDLQVNIEQNGARAQQVNLQAESLLAEWKETPDLVVLDPPRAGVPAAALARLVQLGPPRVTYLSCDPSTLARDLAALTGGPEKTGRYEISEVRLFDVFPQTYHIESLVRLKRHA